MKNIPAGIEGCIFIQNSQFKDERGSFRETFSKERLSFICKHEFVQDNVSISHKNVLRGMHIQTGDSVQGKLVTCLKGRLIDLVVDIRKDSLTYGKTITVLLHEPNMSLFVPRGCLHGFISLEDDTIMHYKCDNYYSKEHEVSYDPLSLPENIFIQIEQGFNIGIDDLIINSKDRTGKMIYTNEGILSSFI
ncbi:gp186 [Sphingomonas phage PAU]|uniref:dTDP-4-dehydrorhamnose 3,5-epimerase n=1 Tax=Sphingomonas phage PAU TaxID=1150991 RepID=UPI0002573358|nr:dTDP-4-dehydrorhamnose 3,5-epimerase [Sphingomonas phage PAU]AFF28184.1 gp186 [Sphingomonas phage PAU]